MVVVADKEALWFVSRIYMFVWPSPVFALDQACLRSVFGESYTYLGRFSLGTTESNPIPV
jgi:hypothetical protein